MYDLGPGGHLESDLPYLKGDQPLRLRWPGHITVNPGRAGRVILHEPWVLLRRTQPLSNGRSWVPFFFFHFLLLLLSLSARGLQADRFWDLIEMIDNGGSSVPCSDGVQTERAIDRSSQTEGLMRASESY